MADSPQLPAPAETAAYAPYSLMAVLAVGLAILYAVLLIVLGISSFVAGQSFIQQHLLVLPLAVLLVAFAARRQIATSEGTRVGTNLCNIAWWIAVLGGAGYLAYLIAINFAIRNDAASAFRDWTGIIATSTPSDPKNTDLLLAFHKTMPPQNQAKIAATDAKTLIGLYQNQYLQFRQCDLVRIATRNKGAVTFDVGALEDWVQEPTGLTCYLGGKMLCPEGEFNLTVKMVRQSVQVKGELQPVWSVAMSADPQAGFLRAHRLTSYGMQIVNLEQSGLRLAYNSFVPATSFALNAMQPNIFPIYSKPQTSDVTPFREIENVLIARTATLGAMGFVQPTVNENDDPVASVFFTPIDPGDPKITEASQRNDFRRCWRNGRITTPGQMIPKNPDANPLLLFSDSKIEMRIPLELQVEVNRTAARGVLVLACEDAAILAKVVELRANPGPPMDVLPDPASLPKVPWRVVRIESDMKSVTLPRPGAGPESGM